MKRRGLAAPWPPPSRPLAALLTGDLSLRIILSRTAQWSAALASGHRCPNQNPPLPITFRDLFHNIQTPADNISKLSVRVNNRFNTASLIQLGKARFAITHGDYIDALLLFAKLLLAL